MATMAGAGELVFCLVTVCLVCSALGETTMANLEVKPGGNVQEYEHSLGNLKCKFVYACQGGTKEEWTISLEQDGNHVVCSVARPGGQSYLFFQQFSLQIQGAKIIEGDAEGDAGRSLAPAEYNINKKHNTVSHVEGKFGSQLSAVRIRAMVKDPKQEL